MNSKDIMTIIESNRKNNEQISLPFVAHDGDSELVVFTYDGYDDSDESMKITTIFRKFIFDLRTNTFKVEVLNDKETRDVKFDQLYDIDELDELYEEYYNKLSQFIKEEISYEELSESFKKLVSDSFMEVYKSVAKVETEQETASNEEEQDESEEEGKVEKAGSN